MTFKLQTHSFSHLRWAEGVGKDREIPVWDASETSDAEGHARETKIGMESGGAHAAL